MSEASGHGLIDLFLDMLLAERGAAMNTIEAYRRDLGDYVGFAAAQSSTPLNTNTALIRRYLADLDRRGLKASSSARKLSALRQFHKFLFAEGHRPDDPAVVLEGPRRGRPLPKVLSENAVTRLIDTAREGIEDPADDRQNNQYA